MNRIARRTGIVFLMALILVAGMVFFLYDYGKNAHAWAVFPGNPHLYNGNNIDCGIVTDADGTLLLDMRSGRMYADEAVLRESTVHWLGDRYGYVSAPAVPEHTEELVGYSVLDGLYSYNGGVGGEARLTMSAMIQRVAMDAMGDYNGTVGVYNYKTGEILCSITKPTYDPDNVPEIDEENEEEYNGIYVNRFLQSAYNPGSIFKIVTTAAALETVEDIDDLVFYCEGSYDVGADTVTCEAYHGVQNMKEAMCNSCNCAYAQLAEYLGDDVIEEYVKKFNITSPVEFDGIRTAEGYFDISDSEQVQVDWAAIGQYTDLVNPCRYMVFMGQIANNGSAAVPYIVGDITVDGSVTYRAETVTEKIDMSYYTAGKLREYMRNNVLNNYGDSYFPGLTVCAKSGTSQTDGEGKANAMFSGFVMDEDYPLAFFIAVENGGYGGMTCPPIMGKILTACKLWMDR